MKYKVGDKVRIQPLEWYQKETEKADCYNIFDIYWCSREMTISKIEKSQYLMEEDGQEFYWTDEMIEGLVEEPIILNGKEILLQLADIELLSGTINIWECPEGYIFKDENGNVINATKIVLEKKKKEYPKTYDECCKVMGIPIHGGIALVGNWCMEDGYIEQHLETLRALSKLLICRDAYWKIAGEEMGLGKPWKPDFTNDKELKFCIGVSEGKIQRFCCSVAQYILSFPTEEMRDAFYENFKELIEICKELL